MKLVIFAAFLCEIFLGAVCLNFFGFWGTFLIYFFPTFFAIPIFAFQNQLAWLQLQRQLALGRPPDYELLNLVGRFFGSVLLFIPSILCRTLAVLLLLPPTRFALIRVTKSWLEQKIAQGSFRIFDGGQGFGFGGSGFRYYNSSDIQREKEVRVERDAQVIDIKPLKPPEE